ncbi:MAG: hypothetical protein QW215_02335 [Ignisphaera sp.]
MNKIRYSILEDRTLYLNKDKWSAYRFNIDGNCLVPIPPHKTIMYRDDKICIKNLHKHVITCYDTDEFIDLLKLLCGDD